MNLSSHSCYKNGTSKCSSILGILIHDRSRVRRIPGIVRLAELHALPQACLRFTYL